MIPLWLPTSVFWINFLSTLLMVGLIWFVQIVHYPLYHQVGASGFALYEALHNDKTTMVVAGPMLLEAFSALALLYCSPSWMSHQEAFWGLVLVGVIWAATGLFSVPDHGKLSLGYDAQVVDHLVAWNWVRTLAWTFRGLGLASILMRTQSP